ncbi:MAG: ribonuclease III domain-containing protein, partial [Eubacteriales bacterium]
MDDFNKSLEQIRVSETPGCTGLLESWPVQINKRWQDINVLVMAYLGDAVYELWVRKHLLEKGLEKVVEIHRKAIGYVQATSQAEILRNIMSELDEIETGVVTRGRNAIGHYPRNVDVVT